MTATAQRRTRTPVAGEESPARPVLAEVHDTAVQGAPGPAAEVRAAAAGLVEAAAVLGLRPATPAGGTRS